MRLTLAWAFTFTMPRGVRGLVTGLLQRYLAKRSSLECGASSPLCYSDTLVFHLDQVHNLTSFSILTIKEFLTCPITPKTGLTLQSIVSIRMAFSW